jgi:hypothetical protein
MESIAKSSRVKIEKQKRLIMVSRTENEQELNNYLERINSFLYEDCFEQKTKAELKISIAKVLEEWVDNEK